MVLFTSDLNHVARCVPTSETPKGGTTTAIMPIEMVYDVYVLNDPTGRSSQAYLIDIPGEMNYEDPTMTRRKRMYHIIPAWYLQNEKKATWGVSDGRLPNTMQLGKQYAYILTDDLQINRPHIYHPQDTALTYPFNLGCEIEDDKNKNANPSRWDGIREALRRFLTNKWVQRLALGFLFGLLISWLWQDIVGPLVGACSFAIISRQSITCPDGSAGERILYRANDCSTHIYDSCTGEDQQTTEPPKAGIGLIEIGVGLAIIIGVVAGAAYLLTRPKKEKAPPPARQSPPEAKGGTK